MRCSAVSCNEIEIEGGRQTIRQTEPREQIEENNKEKL